MSGALTASLELTLRDKLTEGLDKIERAFARLRDLGKTLGLGGLQDGIDALRDVGKIDDLTEGLRGVSDSADAAGDAITRMAQRASAAISVTSDGVARLQHSLGQLALSGSGGGGFGGRMPLLIGGSGGGGARNVGFADGGAPLLLSGPGAPNQIPIDLRTRPSLRGALGNLRGGVSQAVEGYAIYEPIKAYAEYENILRHIGITEKLSGPALDAEIKRLNTLFTKDALSSGQSSESIARAYSDLVQMGIPRRVMDVAIGQHSRAATAYNISAEDLGPAVGSLLQNMAIPETQLGSALAAMAYASKEGRFKVEDFSRQLPGITGQLSLLGVTGRKGADVGFAALETVMKNSSQPNQAAADLTDALHYITSPIAKRSFAKAGIDLPGMLENAAKKGINPLDAVLGRLDSMIAGQDPVKAAETLGRVLHNQQAGMAILSLLQHKNDFLQLRQTLDGVTKATLDTDFASAFADPIVQLRILDEELAQANRIFGQSFLPTLQFIAMAFGPLLWALNWMNTNMPGTLHVVLGTTGALMALGAAMILISATAPVFVGLWSVITGVFSVIGAATASLAPMLGMVFSFIAEGAAALAAAVSGPVVLIVGAIALVAGAAYGIYANWGRLRPFFVTLWADIQTIITGFATWVDGWTGRLGPRILNGIKAGWAVLVTGFGALWHSLEQQFENSWLGRHLGLADAPQLALAGAGGRAALSPVSPRTQVGGTIHITTDGNAHASATTANPAVPMVVAAPDRGRVLGRP